MVASSQSRTAAIRPGCFRSEDDVADAEVAMDQRRTRFRGYVLFQPGVDIGALRRWRTVVVGDQSAHPLQMPPVETFGTAQPSQTRCAPIYLVQIDESVDHAVADRAPLLDGIERNGRACGDDHTPATSRTSLCLPY